MNSKLLGACLLMLLVAACQTIKYTAEPEPLITMKPVQIVPENFYYEADIPFYFWGLAPDEAIVNLTTIAKENGAEYGLTNLRIREEQTAWNALFTYLTLGIYSPRNVQIYGVKR